VVLKPAEYTSLTALLFADICREAGLPKGVVNIVTGDGATGQAIVEHPGIAKIAFTGSTAVGRRIRETTAGTGKSLTLELGGKSPYIVFDDADIDSAIEGLVDAIWFNQGQVCCAGSRLFVQEGIAEDFHTRLKARMDKLRVGDPLDKCIDVGAVVDPVQHAAITRMVDANTEGEVYRAATDLPDKGCFYPPTLITGLSPAAPLMQEEIFGPVLVSGTFRTPAEAVQLANNTRYGLAATLWTENLNLALDIAPKLAAGVVWVNATNLFDAAAPFGGHARKRVRPRRRLGGLAGLSEARHRAETRQTVDPAPRPETVDAPGLDRTAKMYVGGKQARPDGGYSQPSIRNAASFSAMPGSAIARISATRWRPRGGLGMGQGDRASAGADPLLHRREPLGPRGRVRGTHPRPDRHHRRTAEAEVASSVDRLFTYAAWADKFDGVAKSVPIRGVALAMREPVGVIGLWRRTTRRFWGPSRSGAGHRDGQPRGAGAVRPHRSLRPTSTRCSTPRTCRAAW
jgi:aldehyde dehydrogenase (NAD+)